MSSKPLTALPVLLVDDEPVTLQIYVEILHSVGIMDTILCDDSREVMSILTSREVDVILLDIMMPNISGEELLPVIRRDFPGIPVIIVTAQDDTETIVRCMKAGAYDFIVKPIDKNRMVTSIIRAVQFNRLKREKDSLKTHLLSGRLKNPAAFSGIITCNEKLKAIFQYMEAIAASSEPIFITGETGVGKELLAKAFRNLSTGDKTFVTVNAAGLDNNLFSDTFFGHVKGGFTDAHVERKGLVEQAGSGILFLDEVGDLDTASQVKLLRLLQEHEYYPLGADTPKFSNARIIVATNKDVGLLQRQEKFRNDLYYRLCVHHIHIPPLRERPGDIPMLVDYFLDVASKEQGKKKPTVPAELAILLSTYGFPGNIRELRSMVFDAVSRHVSKKMSMDAFKLAIDKNPPANVASESENEIGNSKCKIRFGSELPTLKEAGGLLVREALKRAQNNQSIAARILGISRQALNRR
ncbi:MAG: sigma-54-dependent Fis family transcriptional regulator, partial [bacterium]|nr:sigma-54-dependent Fis family transcriptional regulator [bacterium]